MGTGGGTALEAVLRRDRVLVLGGVVVLSALAWMHIVQMARVMSGMDLGLAMPQMRTWGAGDLFMLFVMWAVMMVAMMVPSAAPVVLLFATINRKRREQQDPFVATGVFLLGYLIVWTGYSALATMAQWTLHAAALLSPLMVTTSPLLGGALLVAAGIFQWSPLKRACLAHCRSPLGFLMTDWREGTRGALVMGLRHGGYCVGCCWVLMALLFVAGVMNLLWVGAIAAFVLTEKVVPRGEVLGRAAGGVLVLAGLVVLGQAWR